MRPKRGRNEWKPNNRFIKKQEYRHCDQLSEKDVYITEYLSPLEGVSGIIKARYSDFQLNEIDMEGNIARLTNTDIPKDFALKMRQYNYNEVMESPHEKIPQETWESLKKIVDDKGEAVTLDAENFDKDTRKEIHNCLKSHFGMKIIGSTVEIDGKKAMKFEKYSKEKEDARHQWPIDKGEYVHFIVYKEKMDTLEAIFKISSSLNMSNSKFNHAGNKDRRAISSQWFCVKKVDPWKLIIKTKNLQNIKLGNITFKDTPLRLGLLKGNRFRIALRNVTAPDDVVNAAMKHLKENNFINYYGLQRFGNDKEVPTHLVGIKLMLGKWKEAVKLILKPKPSDDPYSPQGDIVKAKKIYAETGDAAKAYEALQRNKSKSLEGKLLEGLIRSNQDDYVNALEKVPRQMRLLYLHSFQSLIWNKMVSKRLQLFGMKPVVGDLVLVGKSEAVSEECDTEVDESEGNTSKDESETDVKSKPQVKRLSTEDLDEYSLYDIVLPLPGYDVDYPEHMKSYYKESLEEYGLTLEMPKQRVRTYTLSGGYRTILGKIEDFTCKIVRYKNPTDNLILSDLQQMRGTTEVETDDNGQYKAVIMEFNLSACSYATMLLREITKADTATNSQSKLNNYHETGPEKTENRPQSSLEGQEETQSSSLLADPKKYELFKNSIFSTVDNKPEDGESSPKKQKLEEDTT